MPKPKYYWDANVFLAWLKDEKPPQRTTEEMEGLSEIVQEIDSGNTILITSSLINTEVLVSTLSQDAIAKFQLSLKRSNVHIANVSERVTQLTARIRNFYQNTNKKLKPMDAIHLATAIIYEADEFHTFDPHLLRHNGNVLEYKIKICKPSGKQKYLKFPST